jgi:lipid-A-disaccharide synthase-like uncharacterized protein
MISEEWRTFLYPIGLLSSLAFLSRFLIQWIKSEKEGKSIIPRSFWVISLLGNFLLMLHSIIQMQYPISIIQSCNAVISWRNLNLMGARERQVKFSTVIVLMFLSSLAITAYFTLDSYYFSAAGGWMRSPRVPWQNEHSSAGLIWQLIGTMGVTLFSLRFFLQWWNAESRHKSEITPFFWYLSISGAVMMIIYFTRTNDPVNLLGPCFGIIPYIRNLMLIRAYEQQEQSST